MEESGNAAEQLGDAARQEGVREYGMSCFLEQDPVFPKLHIIPLQPVAICVKTGWNLPVVKFDVKHWCNGWRKLGAVKNVGLEDSMYAILVPWQRSRTFF